MAQKIRRIMALLLAVTVVVAMSPFISPSSHASTPKAGITYYDDWDDDEDDWEDDWDDDEDWDDDYMSYISKVTASSYSSGVKLIVKVNNCGYDIEDVKLYAKKPGSSSYTYYKKINWLDSHYDDYDDDLEYYNFYYKTSKAGTYKFKAIAVDDYGKTVDTAYKTFTYANLKTPVISTKTAGTSKVKISWKKVANASGYKVYRATSKNGKYKLVKTLTSGKTTSYTNKTPSKNKKYYYKVRAYKKMNGSIKYSSYSSKKAGIAGVLKTSIKSITSYSSKVTVKWNKVSSASGYVLYRSTSKNGTYKKIKTITKNSITSYKDSNVYAGSKYYYKIKAYKYINGKKYYSAFSKVKSKTVTALSFTYVKAKAAYKALKNDAVYYPDTLQINHIYSGNIDGTKVIVIDYNAENSYGESIRDYFTYSTVNGYWTTELNLSYLSNKKELSKSKVMN